VRMAMQRVVLDQAVQHLARKLWFLRGMAAE
jgi:hypothetical protein